MTLPLLAPYAMLWLVLMRALLVRARVVDPTCPSCGLKLERNRLGEPVCVCSR